MPKAYLTIDDGPSPQFKALIDFLSAREIPAVFFNRGDAMAARPESVIYGIKAGYIMANHGCNHRRASAISVEDTQDEILETEKILDDLYERADVPRSGKYFRFPYMDRGMGPALVEPENLPAQAREAHHALVQAGLGHTPTEIELCKIHKKRALQNFLQEQGFDQLPAHRITLPWYAQTEMVHAIDSLCTFSTSDWALSARHRGKHGFDTLDDLKRHIDNDPWLHDKSSHHIILAHDQAEIYDTTCALIDYLKQSNFEFLAF